jgi:hypothetical protein
MRIKMKYNTLIFVILLLVCCVVSFTSAGTLQRTTPHFTFITHGSVDTAVVSALASALEGNYERITDDLQTVPFSPIEVNIYAAQWRYILATGNWFASGHIEGPAKMHFVEDSGSPDGSWKIALHEFTHAVFLKRMIDAAPLQFDRTHFDRTFQSLPVWLWEAVSVYEAGQFRDPRTLKYLNAGTHPTLAQLNDRSNGMIYGCGYTIIEFIHHRYGKEKLLALITQNGDLRKVLNISDEEFTTEWYRFVLSKYPR